MGQGALPGATVFFECGVLLERLEGDASFLRQLIEAFGQSQACDLAALRWAIERREASGVERHAHALKGALQNFASGRAVALAFKLELMGREQNLSGALDVFSALETEVALVGQHLDRIAQEIQG